MSEQQNKRPRGRPKKGESVEKKPIIPKKNPVIKDEEKNVVQQNQNPVKDVDEKESVVQHNNDIPNKDIPIQDNDTDSDADLKEFLKPKNKNMAKGDNISEAVDIDEETLREIEEFEDANGVNDIPDTDFNPLDEPVKERGYTGGMNSASNTNYTEPSQEPIIEEPKYNPSGTNKIEVDDNLINQSATNNSNDIPNDIPNSDTKKESGSSSSSSEKAEPKSDDKGDNLKELSKQEKKEAMEKTADAILLAYQQYIPIPFVHFSSFDEKKTQKLHDNDEIDIETQVKKDGTTFREYIKEHNSKVSQAFRVSDEEVEALKDPLVDVLMEQEFAFTPTQRLMFVGGQFLVAKVMMCVKFMREKKSDLEEMKEMHRERMDELKSQFERTQKKESETVKKEQPNVSVVQKEDVPKSENKNDVDVVDNDITEAKIISETRKVESISKSPSLDEVIAEGDIDVKEDDDIPA